LSASSTVQLVVVGAEGQHDHVRAVSREQALEQPPPLQARVPGYAVVDHRRPLESLRPQVALELRRIGLLLGDAEAEGAGVAQGNDHGPCAVRRVGGPR